MSGPGGAYGPMNYGTGPMPGQATTPQMPKPGTVTGIQVILWIFSAISAIGELLSIISLVEYFSGWGLLGVAIAGFFTVKSILASIYIGRGRRWAWILGLIGAILGTIAGAVMVISGAMEFPMMLLIAVPYLALYVTLLSLLCTSSARMWIATNRMLQMTQPQPMMGGATPGFSAQSGAVGNDPQAVAAAMMQMMQKDPSKKPAVYTVMVIFGFIVVASAFVTSIEVIRNFAFMHRTTFEFQPSAFTPYYIWMGAYGVIVVLMLAACIMLLRKMTAAGPMSIIAGVTTTVLLLGSVLFQQMFMFGVGFFRIYTYDVLSTLSGVFGIVIVPCAITFMILSFIPSTRRWLNHLKGQSSAGPAMPTYPGGPPPGGYGGGYPPPHNPYQQHSLAADPYQQNFPTANPYQQYPPQGGHPPY